MTDLRSYLNEQRQHGQTQEKQGTFTMAPHLARRKLADSVPESLSAPWAALGFLRAALEIAGLVPAEQSSGGIVHDVPLELLQKSPVLMGLHFNVPDDWEPVPFQEVLQASCERPFSDSSPLGICLSRAALILSKCDIDAIFQCIGFQIPDSVLCQTGESRVDPSIQKKIVKGAKRCFAVLFSDHEEWHWARSSGEHDGFENQKRRLKVITEKTNPFRIAHRLFDRAQERELSLLGIPMQMHSIWTRSPSQEILEYLFQYESAGNWFNYRAKRAVLLEMLCSSEVSGPLLVSKECLSANGSHQLQKHGKNMTSWQRFRTQGEKLILRHWTEDPKQDKELLPVKAVFSVALTEAASKVTFTNWGQTLVNTSIPNCPPGLAAFVHWPQLKQSLYGDSWVIDEEYEKALKWTTEQANKAFDLLRSEFDYVWEMLVRDHVKKSYRSEVKSRLQAWLKAE